MHPCPNIGIFTSVSSHNFNTCSKSCNMKSSSEKQQCKILMRTQSKVSFARFADRAILVEKGPYLGTKL